jgi:hypothetical protein
MFQILKKCLRRNVNRLLLSAFLIISVYSCHNNLKKIGVLKAFSKLVNIDTNLSQNILIEKDELFLNPQIFPKKDSKTDTVVSPSSVILYSGEIDTTQDICFETNLYISKTLAYSHFFEYNGIHLELLSKNNHFSSSMFGTTNMIDFCFSKDKIIISEFSQGLDEFKYNFNIDINKFISQKSKLRALVIKKVGNRLFFYLNSNLVHVYAPRHWFDYLYVSVKSYNYFIFVDKFNLDYCVENRKENTELHKDKNTEFSINWNSLNIFLAIIASVLTIIASFFALKKLNNK